MRPARHKVSRYVAVPVAVGATVLAGLAGGLAFAHPEHAASTATDVSSAARPHPLLIGPLKSHRLLVVGASYTQGLGAVPVTNGYAYLVGRQLAWPTTVAGASGTGFLNRGPQHQGTFGERIARLPRAPQPGLVLVQCGRNDIGYPDATLRAAVAQTVAGIRARYPGAQIVFLGSIPGQAPAPPSVHGVDGLLRDEARRLKVPFIDPIAEQWITKADARGFTGQVAAHPNNAGYAFIARQVVADLIKLGNGQIVAGAPAERSLHLSSDSEDRAPRSEDCSSDPADHGDLVLRSTSMSPHRLGVDAAAFVPVARSIRRVRSEPSGIV